MCWCLLTALQLRNVCILGCGSVHTDPGNTGSFSSLFPTVGTSDPRPYSSKLSPLKKSVSPGGQRFSGQLWSATGQYSQEPGLSSCPWTPGLQSGQPCILLLSQSLSMSIRLEGQGSE